MDFTQIKLLVWDLDETLWQGVLSEGEVSFPEENKKMICDAVNAGVMCAICSKNDLTMVTEKLREEGLLNFFVFNSVNWHPKGDRVKQIIDEMKLRPVNVMFIDDNPSNRAEVKAVCKDITVMDVDVIPQLRDFFATRNTKDIEHERLKQYQMLEKKRDFQAKAGSNLAFLAQSNIRVTIGQDCGAHLDRIYDLVCRSNQLNFTKIRSTKEELEMLFADSRYQCGYVSVTDNFGDYGIVGFYAQIENELLHFTFSCRTLGMGVEQYVYQLLKKPKLTIVGEVSSSLDAFDVDWINQEKKQEVINKENVSKGKVLIKGPCDMEQMFAYIAENRNITTEFVYVNDKGVSIEGGNHTEHIIQSRLLNESEQLRLAQKLPFGDKGMFKTAVFDSDVDFVVLSLFTDPNLGLYREKSTGITVAFGEYTNDLTDTTRWEQYINKQVFVANCDFTEESLEMLAQEFEFIGRITPQKIVSNLEEIYQNIASKTKMVLVLGSELEYTLNQKPAYADRHLYHRQLNAAVRDWAKDKDRVRFIDINEILLDSSGFTNNINHFTRQTYYQMSTILASIIAETNGGRLKQNGEFVANLVHLFRRIKKLPKKLKALMRKS